MRLSAILLGFACMIGLTSCGLVSSAISVAHPTVAGSVTLTAADGKATTFTPDGCYSGDHENFLGFDLLSSKTPMQLRAVIQPIDGLAARLRSKEGGEFSDVVLRKAECRTLELTLNPTNWTVNDYRDFNGKLNLDCSTPAGARIEGSVEITHCH